MAEIGEPDHIVRRERTPVPTHAPSEPVHAPAEPEPVGAPA
jgi:hypothetical protein